ncbi:MAG: RloB family protein [Bacteroidia bacterium]
MILKNRLFEREEPSEEAKTIFIFCEGRKREHQYFSYFEGIDSRIKLEVYKLNPHEDNSPLGLLKIAKECLLNNETNKNPKYDFRERDEVWLVFDIDPDKYDSRKPQIEQIIDEVNMLKNWRIARSNPCFEVWLYAHFSKAQPQSLPMLKCEDWKRLVNHIIPGGFDSRKHPIFISEAISNSKDFNEQYKHQIGSTEVYQIGESILDLIYFKIQQIRQGLGL